MEETPTSGHKVSERSDKDTSEVKIRAQAFREAVFYVTFWIIDTLTMGWAVYMTGKVMEYDAEWMKTYQLRATKKK